MNILVQILVAVAMMVLSYVLAPKQKQTKNETSQGDKPTASAGKPIPVVFGTLRITDPNCLWYGDSHFIKSKVDQ